MSKPVQEWNKEILATGVRVKIPDNIPSPESEKDPVVLVCANCGKSINEENTTIAKAKRGDYWCSHCYPKGADNH